MPTTEILKGLEEIVRQSLIEFAQIEESRIWVVSFSVLACCFWLKGFRVFLRTLLWRQDFPSGYQTGLLNRELASSGSHCLVYL